LGTVFRLFGKHLFGQKARRTLKTLEQPKTSG